MKLSLRFSVLSVLLLAACGDPNAGATRGNGGQQGLVDDQGRPVNEQGELIGEDGLPLPNDTDDDPSGSPDDPDSVDVDDDDPDFVDDPDGNPSNPDDGEVVDVTELPDDADPVTSNDVFLAARVRRLTNVEYQNTIADLLDINVDIGSLPADSRQNDFTRNGNQAVDPVLGGHYQTLAKQIAADVVARGVESLASCAGSSPDAACARTLITQFGQSAYRRPLLEDEVDALATLYEAGAEGQEDAFSAGIEVVLQAMLQSASFLYLSEIGPEDAAAGEIVLLNPWELASSLSYLLTAHPPDAELVALASDGTILEPAVRRAQAERLLATPEAEVQIRRFIKQWLKLDQVGSLDKADDRFPALREPMEAEADAFISAIAVNGDGRLSTLLTAGYTFVGPEMAAFYGVTPDAQGRASLDGTGRAGLLQLASFLSANSHNDESGPIKRGVAVLRKVMCANLPNPSDVDDPEVMMVMPPARNEELTTRQRFQEHSTNPKCASCHDLIDGIGFTFENFGAIGDIRDTEAGQAVDTSGTLDGKLDGTNLLADSVELSLRLAEEPRVTECFARHVYRYGAASTNAEAEATFIRGLTNGSTLNDNVKVLLVGFSGSNSFLLRRTPVASEQIPLP